MKVVEIFSSIEGEGRRSGELATFIRFAGCNLACSYCDTQYALNHETGASLGIKSLLKEAISLGNRNITLTGGEPLLNKDLPELVNALTEVGFWVNIETNGSLDVSPFLANEDCFLTVDYKMPSSGFSDSMRLENFSILRRQDVIKCVVQEEDLNSIEEVMGLNDGNAYFYISPVFGKIDPVLIVQKMKELSNRHLMQRVRVQMQLHKLIWKPEMRGV